MQSIQFFDKARLHKSNAQKIDDPRTITPICQKAFKAPDRSNMIRFSSGTLIITAQRSNEY